LANSRDKGVSFERKICSLIKHALGYDAKRNLYQYQVGGADIEIPGWSIECKAYQRSGSNSYKTSWWEQCVANCGDKEPVLIYKYNNCPIKCVIRLDVFEHGFSTNQDLVCEVDIDTWFYIVREKI
jgi:hypothetical protein